MTRILMGMVPLLLVAQPALAQSVNAEQPVAVKKPRKVCRSVEVTGRRIGTSICHTSDEWAQIDKADEEASRKFTADVMENERRSRSGGADGTGGSSALAGTGLGLQ